MKEEGIENPKSEAEKPDEPRRNFFQRMSFDLTAVVFLFFIVLFIVPISYFPAEARMGFFSLIITKFLLVSCGILHFHITRKVMFPYIDFKFEEDWSNNLMIITMFVIIVWAWARGG